MRARPPFFVACYVTDEVWRMDRRMQRRNTELEER